MSNSCALSMRSKPPSMPMMTRKYSKVSSTALLAIFPVASEWVAILLTSLLEHTSPRPTQTQRIPRRSRCRSTGCCKLREHKSCLLYVALWWLDAIARGESVAPVQNLQVWDFSLVWLHLISVVCSAPKRWATTPSLVFLGAVLSCLSGVVSYQLCQRLWFGSC
jgi:hypothetical protein